MKDDELSELLRELLLEPRLGVERDGIYVQKSYGYYRLPSIIHAVRKSDNDTVTDSAWHLLRGIADTLPPFLANAPHLSSAPVIRDTKEQLAAIIRDLRFRLVARTQIVSEWEGRRGVDEVLNLIGMLNDIPYSYSADIVQQDGKPHTLHAFLPHKTYEEAFALNATSAVYRVVTMPNVSWRTLEDGMMVLGEKCHLIRAIARAKGEYPHISSKLQIN